jgi:hypothetical protein
MGEVKFVEYELAEDVKEFIAKNQDVTFQDQSLKERIDASDDTSLLKVTKTIGSPIKIVEVEEATVELIERELSR